MRKIGPLGKKSYAGKKFKSAGPNELNASDKNYIRNNINLFNIQLLAFKVGKPVAAVEKFIKKEKLVPIVENQETKELVFVEVQTTKLDKTAFPKEKKVDKIIKKSISVEVQLSKPDKTESQKEKKVDKIIKKSISVEVQLSKLDKTESQKEKKIDKITNKKLSVETPPSKLDKIEAEIVEEKAIKRSDIVAEKVDFIRENHQKYNAIELAKMLNASVNGVRYHLKNLNVVKTPYKVVKTLPEVILARQKFIKENHKKYTVRELSEQLDCSCDIVRINLRKLNIKALRVPQGQEITPQVINFIRVSYRTMTAREMSKALGDVSWTQIKYLCEKHGFLKTPEETNAIRHRWNRSEFTVNEEKFIIMNHGIIPLSEIAQHLRRTRSSIIQHLSRKGLKISKEQHDALNRKNFEKARIKFQEKIEEKAKLKLELEAKLEAKKVDLELKKAELLVKKAELKEILKAKKAKKKTKA
jgi:hypothetical protein